MVAGPVGACHDSDKGVSSRFIDILSPTACSATDEAPIKKAAAVVSVDGAWAIGPSTIGRRSKTSTLEGGAPRCPTLIGQGAAMGKKKRPQLKANVERGFATTSVPKKQPTNDVQAQAQAPTEARAAQAEAAGAAIAAPHARPDEATKEVDMTEEDHERSEYFPEEEESQALKNLVQLVYPKVEKEMLRRTKVRTGTNPRSLASSNALLRRSPLFPLTERCAAPHWPGLATISRCWFRRSLAISAMTRGSRVS